MKNQSPAFQFYASDYVGGTQHFTAEESGCYIRLLCHQWMNGFVPNNRNRICSICGSLHDPTSIDAPLAKFEHCGDGNLRNEKMEKVRAEQIAFKKSKAEAGRKGGLATQEDKRNQALLEENESSASNNGKRKPSPPISDLRSPSSYSDPQSPSPISEAGLSEKIGNLVIQLKQEIDKHCQRNPEAQWHPLEEHYLIKVIKRKDVMKEWHAIRTMRDSGKQSYPRQSVRSLLEYWHEEADKAVAINKTKEFHEQTVNLNTPKL